MMGPVVLALLALISTTLAAPTPQQWKCYRQCDGSTVCFGQPGCPSIGQPCINFGQNCQPPSSCPATVYTPSCNPCNPCNPCAPPCNPCNPCPCPSPCPCPPPCPQPDPCPCYQ